MKFPKIFKLSPKTTLLQWQPVISEEAQQVLQQTEQLMLHHFSEEISEMTLAYNELAIYWKTTKNPSAFEEKLKMLLNTAKNAMPEKSATLVTIPVCYEAPYALDLAEVAAYHKISEEEVVQLHSQPLYNVSFIGFLPGFPYLTGLSEKLHTPRKETPRTSLAKGSVGIGGAQTGVYPGVSPGGWQIIGRSPLQFFSTERASPSLLTAGDSLQFQPISKSEFEQISLEVASGVYQVKTEII
tara:strand:- start:5655 stop:6377 length:723 start_codon:yes stop_codon:yes gene_type:complete